MWKSITEYKAERYGLNFDPDALAWDYIKDFLKWTKTNGVKTIFTPVPFLKREKYYNIESEKRFYEQLTEVARGKGLMYVGEPYDFMYEEEGFFNKNYHLTS